MILRVDVHGLMLVLVLPSQNVQITQLQQLQIQLNVILKIQHVFQEQLQEHQFHAQQEQLHAQMLKTKTCVTLYNLPQQLFAIGQLHASVKIFQNAQQLLIQHFAHNKVVLMPIANVVHQHVPQLQSKHHAQQLQQTQMEKYKFVHGLIMHAPMQLILQL